MVGLAGNSNTATSTAKMINTVKIRDFCRSLRCAQRIGFTLYGVLIGIVMGGCPVVLIIVGVGEDAGAPEVAITGGGVAVAGSGVAVETSVGVEGATVGVSVTRVGVGISCVSVGMGVKVGIAVAVKVAGGWV